MNARQECQKKDARLLASPTVIPSLLILAIPTSQVLIGK